MIIRRKQLRLFVGIRLDPRDPYCLTAAENLRLTVAPDLPIHWNFPSSVFSGPERESWQQFATSLTEEHDAVLSMGYAGLHHPMLLFDELRRELDWGFRNPMDPDSGHRTRSSVLLCRTPDLCRSEALSFYVSRGIAGIAIADRGELVFEQNLIGTSGELRLIRYHRLRDLKGRSPRQIWRSLHAVGESRLFVLAETFDDMARLPDFLAAMTARLQITVGLLDQEPIWALENVRVPADCLLPSDSFLRASAMAANKLRARRRNKEETLKILQILNLQTRTNVGSIQAFPPPDRDNVADMQGSVDLAEGGLTAHFDSGRLAGLSQERRAISPRLRSRARILADGTHREIAVTAAFSIESESIRGLRVVASEDPAGPTGSSLLLDHFFVEDFPYLVTTCRVTYPKGTAVQEIVPFELPVAQIHGERGKYVVEAMYRDGHQYRVNIDSGVETVSVAGSLFYVPQGGLVIWLPHAREPVVEALRLRVEPNGEGTVLYAGLCGTYEAGSETMGAQELFTFFLGTADRLPPELPRIPRAVLAEIPDHAIQWD